MSSGEISMMAKKSALIILSASFNTSLNVQSGPLHGKRPSDAPVVSAPTYTGTKTSEARSASDP